MNLYINIDIDTKFWFYWRWWSVWSGAAPAICRILWGRWFCCAILFVGCWFTLFVCLLQRRLRWIGHFGCFSGACGTFYHILWRWRFGRSNVCSYSYIFRLALFFTIRQRPSSINALWNNGLMIVFYIIL